MVFAVTFGDWARQAILSSSLSVSLLDDVDEEEEEEDGRGRRKRRR